MPACSGWDAIPAWADALLICPQCRASATRREQGSLICRSCDATFPVNNGVALMLRPDRMTDTAVALGQRLGGVPAEAVESALGTALRYRLHDRTLRDEFTQIVERYAAIFDGLATDVQPLAVDAKEPARVELKTEYYNPNFTPGETSYRSFRILNSGDKELATTGDKPFNLSYWLEAEDGTLVEGVRSNLPIPLLPGRELTVPVRIIAPVEEGRYRLQVMLVQEFVGWQKGEPIFVGELIVRSVIARGPELVQAPHSGFFDFDQDLERCGEMIARAVGYLRERAGDAALNVIEVACGNDPQTLRHYQAGTNVVACDLAFPQVQLGALSFRRRSQVPPDRFAFMAADVFNMPFPSGTFDLVVVCAALHHFVDVVEALKHLRALLAPGGLLLLMREPGKVAPNDPTYIAELANGFNEQQFVLAEYVTMFERAGLTVRYHRMDFECSYKVLLERDDLEPGKRLGTKEAEDAA